MELAADYQGHSGWYAPYSKIRVDSYVLLASFLTGPPSEELLDISGTLLWNDDIPERLHTALSTLSHACRNCSLADFSEEFHRLFVGLGRGELVPYESWYLEKMIQSKPLAALREDLTIFGIARQNGSCEPEDHAGVVCEIMALLSLPENGVSFTEQAGFFDRHVVSWMMTFFDDLCSLSNGDVYRTVGLFGSCFLETENEYLHKMASKEELSQ